MTTSTAEILEGAAFSDTAAPAPSALTPPAVFPQSCQTERSMTTKRRPRVDWYTLGVLLLLLASGAVCLYRLAWAMQP